MYNEEFPIRLAKLREEKGVSARDMSLSLGQNPGYINNIENGKGLPSMTVFFYICEYLEVSPSEFFDIETESPQKLNVMISYLKKLDSEKLSHITEVVKDLTEHK